MRRYIFLILCLLLITAVIVYAGEKVTGVEDPVKVGGVAGGKVVGVTFGAASSCAYVHCNGLEAQSDDDDWTTVGGSPDYDNTSFAVEGSESMQLTAGESASIAVSARAETWITFYIHTNDNNEATENLVLLYNDSTLLGTVLYDNDNNWKIEAEGGSTSAGETVNVNSGTDYIKVRFKQGTGANAEIEFWASSDGTNWGSNQSVTDGTSTAQVNKILFQNTHDNEIMYIDNFLENSANIADAT